MRVWPRTWWPRTLSAQLVVVTTSAVLASNLAVVLWFGTNQALQNEAALRDRIADRAASMATLLSHIPAKDRQEAVQTMSTGPWDFHLQYGTDIGQSMTGDEARLAARVRSLLQPQRAKYPVSVSMRIGELPPHPRQGLNRP